jgi:DNA-binding response OmpR family regulator
MLSWRYRQSHAPSGVSVTTQGSHRDAVILVTDDVEETRDGIERLLKADGYRVDPARSEEDAVDRATRQPPDLILVSLSGPSDTAITSARRIRRRAGLSDEVLVVIFCVQTVEEGAEVALGRNVYVTRPDNFDQLRGLLGRLLRRPCLSG